MKIGAFMAAVTPDPAFAGHSTADDWVLGIGYDIVPGGNADNYDDFLLMAAGIREHSGAINTTSSESTYIRTSVKTTKTGAARQITINGDRIFGDEGQDAALASKELWGTGSQITHPYVYFNRLTGEGEKGWLDLIVNEDITGEASTNQQFSIVGTSTETPTDFTYAAYVPPTP